MLRAGRILLCGQNTSRTSWTAVLSRSCSQSVQSGVPYEHQLKDHTKDAPTEVPASADVVIVGGGVIGCATMYYLTKMGQTNVVLLEKDDLTAGTTWHTAGLVWRLRPNDVDIQLLNRSRDLMQELEEETGVNPGWINNGGLFIASRKERLDEYKRLHTLGKVFGIESHVLGPSETKKLYPLLNVDDVYGTVYSPGDGTIDPAGYCTALTRAATRLGGKVLTKCAVTGIDVQTDDFGTRRVQAVQTSSGTIKTNCVVNCTGVWAPKIGKMAGVKTPLVAMRHAYVVTERIEGIQNMPNVRDHDASVYLKLQGDALQVGGYEPNPIFWEDVKDDFAFSLFDLDWDVFSVHIEGAVNRVPKIGDTGIKSTVCGPESFTPDHKALLGEAPEVRGFFHGCGFNSLGMNLSAGCAKQLADWIIQGRPTLDMYGYDIRRFTEKLTDNYKWIVERSHEAYAKNYSIVYPHDEPLACRNMRKDALTDTLEEAGCVFEERQGWERPGWYSPQGPAKRLSYDYYGSYDYQLHDPNTYYERLQNDYTFDFPVQHDIIGKECLTCRESVAIFNMSYFGKYYLVGPDAQKAADWIFSNDMQKPEGHTVYTCMLNQAGGVEADLTVSAIEPGSGGPHAPKFEGRGFYLAAGGGAAQQNYSHIQTVIQDQKFNCHLIDHSDDMALMSIQGPKSRELLQTLTDADLSNEAFPFSTNKVVTVAGHEVRALRLSFVGEMGWELHVPNVSCLAVYHAVMDAGAKYGITNAGYRAIDSLSLEKGYRHWHADLRIDDTPLESLLGFTCKLKTDTPFLGREALERQKKEGIKKRIACFSIDDHVPLHGLEAIWRDGEAVGFLRRAEYAFALGKSIGYGYVRCPDGSAVTADFMKSGVYTLEHMGATYPAKLHLKSPFDPQNKRVKGIYDEPLPIHKVQA
ncbi:sarcosine dehydrogenase, mitochondrial [Lingula anatina]|uniref:Sarcosine dehydrogenase, mitochondrial n=1 Tax=Lingula anatina TaxID=7574 RepID=A0A1S3IUE1_LINAN|nr:sarcosine dehydrogenase, mitochondrial [Lingula anatina]|eukprot:XP_013401693.1 sarcosine dehydrogenase, mitochondrial [Lingula anatina]